MSIQYLQWIDHTKRVVFDAVIMFVVVFPDDSSRIRYYTIESEKNSKYVYMLSIFLMSSMRVFSF